MGKHKSRHFDKKNAQRYRLIPGAPNFFGASSSPDENEVVKDDEQRKREQNKYGIYYEDDYNYLQHLKSSSEASHIELFRCQPGHTEPTTSLAASDPVVISKEEICEVDRQIEDVDMEDVVAGNSDLEDDFIIQANCGVLPSLEEHGLTTTKPEIDSVDTSFKKFSRELYYYSDTEEDSDEFDIDEFKSSFHAAQTTSRKQPERSLIDDRFDKILESYDDDDIGALDEEEIAGGSLQPSDDLFKQAEEDFEKTRRVNKKKTVAPTNLQPLVENVVSRRPACLSEDEEDVEDRSDENDELEKIEVQVKQKPSKLYNCESILSITSSCTPAHCPRLIVDPVVKQRNVSTTKSFNEIKNVRKPIVHSCEEEKTDDAEIILSRHRNETAEERKLRKAEVRERKKERREQKKAIKTVFGREKCAAERQLATSMAAVRLS